MKKNGDQDNSIIHIRKELKNPTRKSIRCYTYKQKEDLNRSVEKLLQKEYNQDNSEQTSKSTCVKNSQDMMIFNDELEDGHIEHIKDSLLNHYLFKDMSDILM